jgi:hypothetical protein
LYRRVGVGVGRARHQVVVPQAVQQAVEPRQRVELAEAFLDPLAQDRPVVRRQPLLRRRAGFEHVAQLLLFLDGELGRSARLLAWPQRLDAATAVAADPLVDELPRASDTNSDLFPRQLLFVLPVALASFPAVAGQQHHAETVTLLGVSFDTGQLAQLCRVLRRLPLNDHASRLLGQ